MCTVLQVPFLFKTTRSHTCPRRLPQPTALSIVFGVAAHARNALVEILKQFALQFAGELPAARPACVVRSTNSCTIVADMLAPRRGQPLVHRCFARQVGRRPLTRVCIPSTERPGDIRRPLRAMDSCTYICDIASFVRSYDDDDKWILFTERQRANS